MANSTHANSPKDIYEKMMQNDRFSDWLGLVLDDISEGYCKMHFTIRPEMLNGFKTVHGGILFSAADSAFAFACNSHGLIAVALEASIHYLRPVHLDDQLTVEARLVFLGRKTGVYQIRITNEQNEQVCLFNATAYRTSKPALP